MTEIKCSVQDCDKDVMCKGLCGNHYRLNRQGHKTKICSIDKCSQPHWAKGYCKSHYVKVKRGTLNKHHRLLPNTLVIKEDCFIIILRDNKGNVIGESECDIEDLEKVSKYKWKFTNGYTESQRVGFLHRFVMDAKPNELIDHKNQIRSDCKKANLRRADKSINGQNSKMYSTNTSGYRGVYYHKLNKNWVANIRIDGKTINLGSYEDIIDAAKAYNDAAIARWGTIGTVLNKIPSVG